jgi:hypothetical protein
MRWIAAVLLAGAAWPALAQQRDFLTTSEVDQVREAQEPNLRLKLYVLFARQRMDQFQQLLKKDRKGRSLEARQLLEDYANIIDAMVSVSDDALKRHVPVAEGLAAAAAAEKKFLAQFEKVDEAPPADMGLYDTAFKEAMSATSDAIEMAQGDTSARAVELVDKDDKEKKQSRTILAEEDHKGDPAAIQAAVNSDPTTVDGKPKRKPPTLMRPGEKSPTASQ